MASGFLLPVGALLQIFSDQGIVGNGFKINTYVGGSVNTPQQTFTDSTLTTPNSNPVVMGQNGRFQNVNMWVASGTLVKLVLTDANNNVIAGGTIDNIPGINDVGQSIAAFQLTAGEIAAGVTPVNFGYLPGTIPRYGTNTTPGVTDMGAAINTMMSANTVGNLLDQDYFTSVTITVPAGKMLQGVGFANPVSGGAAGTRIHGALTLTPVVQLGADTLVASSLRGLNVLRAAGSPGAATIGVRVFGGQCPTVEDVFSFGHGYPFYLDGNQAAPGAAISFEGEGMFTGAAVTSHIVIDTWPEARFNQCRFGTNGTGDLASTSYIQVQGGKNTSPAAGPNTIVFNNCQFNQGANSATYCWNFINLLGTLPTVDARIFQMNACHIEAVGTAIFHADSSWTSIERCMFGHNSFNTPAADMFSVPNTIKLNAWQMNGNWIACANFTCSVAQLNGFALLGNNFGDPVAGTGCTAVFGVTGNGNVCSMGNIWNGASTLTVNGTTWKNSIFADSYGPSASFTNNAQTKGLTVINPGTPNSLIPIGPLSIMFGGAQVGLSSSSAAHAQIDGQRIHIWYQVTLTAKGSSTGAATVTGLPFAMGANADNAASLGLTMGANMSGLTAAPMIAQGVAGGTSLNLLQATASGTAAVNDTNFTNTSVVTGEITLQL